MQLLFTAAAVLCAVRAQLPLPSGSQLEYLMGGPTQFMHFGMCTFNGCQWNVPFHPLSTFNPTQVMMMMLVDGR